MGIEQEVDQMVVENEESKVQVKILNKYMEKSSIKVQLAKQIGDLQQQLEFLNSEFKSSVGKYESLKKDLMNSSYKLKRSEESYNEIERKAKTKYKDEVDGIKRLQKQLNAAVEEENRLIKDLKMKNSILDGAKNEFMETEDRAKNEHMSRSKQYAETEKGLNTQLVHISRQQKENVELAHKYMKEQSNAEIANSGSKKLRAEVVRYEQSVKKRADELTDERDKMLGELRDKTDSLEKACNLAVLERRNYEGKVEELNKRIKGLNDREIAVTEREKGVKEKISQYKLNALKDK